MPTEPNTQVTVVDIQMPFWSMVVFLVKVAIASIPAVIILSILGTIFFAIMTALFGVGMHT
ncbi:hypothetical protein [uncultured Thiocystis sp.]|jgi:hypothetical protein|uniref:hypothetical protein n=1 Tax=uncultured Thiocystis sp. TaxID=1202134 RepID=UPI0025FAD1EC|nr:hypothetical protein [uncultured Thiocystis sp.]